jgi:hypothetical protein
MTCDPRRILPKNLFNREGKIADWQSISELKHGKIRPNSVSFWLGVGRTKEKIVQDGDRHD